MVPASLVRHPLRWLLPIQAVLLCVRLGLMPTWGDEQFTLNVVGLSWGQLGTALAADIHPPLYFALLKVWMSISLTEPIVWARLFSSLAALGTTFALDRLWLRSVSAETRVWFLALWCFSPLLLLDARMARSYALQTLFSVLALAAMVCVTAQATWRRSAILGGAIAVLSYVHYLPGIAIGVAAVCVVGKKSLRHASIVAGVAVLLYAPWVPVLLDGLHRASSKDVYWLAAGSLAELGLRLGYWFNAFSFGEAHVWATLLLAALLSPVVALFLVRGVRTTQADVVRASLLAAPIGFLGTWRWVSFAFTPARLLFLLPAFLLTLSTGAGTPRGRRVLAGLLALNLAGIGLYFSRTGFLNLGYLVPYEEMARRIEAHSAPGETVVLVDAFNGDPKPLQAALNPDYAVIVAEDLSFTGLLRGELQSRHPTTVWRLGSSRTLAPAALHQAITDELDASYSLAEMEQFLPYSSLQRTLFARFSEHPAPAAYFVSERWERKKQE